MEGYNDKLRSRPGNGREITDAWRQTSLAVDKEDDHYLGQMMTP